MTMRALNEGARALALWVAVNLDVAQRHEDEDRRQAADDLVAVLTPVIKSFLTDIGFEATNLGMQVFGGHGYIKETGMEQLVRDARIAQIYEGANGVQALDLVGRKLGQGNGRLLRRFFHPVRGFLESHRMNLKMAEFVQPTAKAYGRLQRATLWIAQKGLADPEEAGAAASDYLRLFGLTALAYLWARAAEVSLEKANGEAGDFHAAKLATARYYMQRSCRARPASSPRSWRARRPSWRWTRRRSRSGFVLAEPDRNRIQAIETHSRRATPLSASADLIGRGRSFMLRPKLGRAANEAGPPTAAWL